MRRQDLEQDGAVHQLRRARRLLRPRPAAAALAPDSIPPILTTTDVPGAFNRYGFRVPLMVVSPWARANYVSRVVQDHTSVLAFIERKWNLPAMTFRDANAHPMTDYFNFRHAGVRDAAEAGRRPVARPRAGEVPRRRA